MKVIKDFETFDGSSFQLESDGTRWQVSAFNRDGEHHWTVDRNPNTGVLFDEAAATAEFERWMK